MTVAIISVLIASTVAHAGPNDRTYEGNWYVSDTTDNNTGEREVYAFQMHLERDDPDFVTLRMRCSKGQPTFFVEWEHLPFPDQTVLTLGPVANPDSEPTEQQYVFQKSEDPVENGLRASPETSAKIVAAMGQAKYLTVTAYLESGIRTVGMDVDGTQRAWSRVSRHCPVQTMPRPPL
jgi:hypothetical protein